MVANVTAAACGFDREQLFKEAGIPLSAWDSVNRVNQEELTALWKLAQQLTGRVDLGLDVLDHFHFRTIGSLAFKMMVAKTFRQSILEALDQISLVSEVWKFSLTEERGLGVMRFRLATPNLEVTHYSYDAFICACVRVLQDCFPSNTYKYAEIWFAHPDFGLKEKYESKLNARCRFNCKEYALCLDGKLLDLPLQSADPQLYESLDTSLDHQVRTLNSQSAIIEKAILKLIDEGVAPSRHTVSAKLEIGERTLLRRLKDENLTYKEVQEQVFEKLTLRRLQRGEAMESIAEKLGYSDAKSLGKMLKRRTGLGIRQLRQST
nr:AraC family transcriptional regulator ligand-binding domain-containing protein [Zhongshania antarctica]